MSADQPLVAHRLPSLTSRSTAARPLSAQPVGPPVYARRSVLDVVWCAFAMAPSCSPFRCFVVLLLVAAAGLLARPAEASKRLFAGIVDSAARRHGVDPDLVHAVIAVESGYRATAQSPAGAQGLMQLMPGTQRDLGVSDAFDPRQNVDAGVAYLRRLTDEFGTVLAIAAYNAGPGAVRRYNGIPPYAETRAYVRAVLDRGRPAVGAKATEEHDPSKDRALAVSEADVTEDAAPADRRLQDDHLAMDAAAGLEPQMLNAALDPDYRTAAPPDQLVMLRDAQAGTLGQGIADERPIQVGGAGSTHAAVARFVWLRQFEPRSNSADANRLLDRRESHEIAQNRSFRTVSGAKGGRSVPDRSVPANAHGSESVRAAGPAGIQTARHPLPHHSGRSLPLESLLEAG